MLFNNDLDRQVIMAGIDKVYLKNYNEYKYLKSFLIRHDSEFFKVYNYSLSEMLYDLDNSHFNEIDERPVSNFSLAADVFIIQHFLDEDIISMPNVWNRLKVQHRNDFELIRNHTSCYDKYRLDLSGCKIKLTKSSNNKTIRHIKREHWSHCSIHFVGNKNFSKKKIVVLYPKFNYFYRCFYDWRNGCKYDRYDPVNHNFFCEETSMKQIIKYITNSGLKKDDIILVNCWGLNNGKVYDNEADYEFIVI
jgi:hypothetical protein